MKPSVDWCDKKLMRNPKARKGFTAALLQIKPEEIGETILLENEPPKEAEEAKRTVEEFRKLVESTECYSAN